MKPIGVILAVEDLLSESVARALLTQTGKAFSVTQTLPLRSNVYLREKAPALNRTAKGFPIVLITDLDRPNDCSPALIQRWLEGEPRHPNLLFRVAVMEIESWVMAHWDVCADFLGVPISRIPLDTDKIEKPKEFLLTLARKSRSSRLKSELLPSNGATSKVGPGYNSLLGYFVRERWRAREACEASPSLKRAFERLVKFDMA